MKIILSEDVAKLGHVGDKVEVSDGYAKNFLIPKKLAVMATKAKLKEIADKKASLERKLEEERKQSVELVNEISGKTFFVTQMLGKNGKSYGSVTSQDVSDAIKAQLGLDIDKKRIILPDNIKELGPHDCKVKFFQDIVADIIVEVRGADNESSEKTE